MTSPNKFASGCCAESFVPALRAQPPQPGGINRVQDQQSAAITSAAARIPPQRGIVELVVEVLVVDVVVVVVVELLVVGTVVALRPLSAAAQPRSVFSPRPTLSATAQTVTAPAGTVSVWSKPKLAPREYFRSRSGREVSAVKICFTHSPFTIKTTLMELSVFQSDAQPCTRTLPSPPTTESTYPDGEEDVPGLGAASQEANNIAVAAMATMAMLIRAGLVRAGFIREVLIRDRLLRVISGSPQARYGGGLAILSSTLPSSTEFQRVDFRVTRDF